MTLRLALLGLITAALYAAEPVRSFWIMSPPGGTATARILPDVHAVEVTENAVTVRSAGISLRFLGPLEASPLPSEKVHEFVFRFPRHPAPETGTHARIPPDVAGAFLNGVPVYNQFEAQSFNTANLWHYDPMVRASGTGLLEQLAEATGRHSPIIGFALDGYPIYGPWAFANPDATGGVRRMRSGYRLRKTSTRHDWPDGTALTPEQYGPDVTPDAPLVTFAEDYEFAPDPGDPR